MKNKLIQLLFLGKIYENDFKIMMVELLKSGKSIKEVSQEYGLNDIIILLKRCVTVWKSVRMLIIIG